MHDLTSFEQRLSQRLEAEHSIQPSFDPAIIAAAAMVRRSPLDRFVNALRIGDVQPTNSARRLAIAAVVALLLLATIALAIGTSRGGGGRLALVRTNGDVVLASVDGSDQRLIGHVAFSPLWLSIAIAPDGGHVAFKGDDLTLTIVDRTGEITFSRKLEDGNSQYAWSPDGQRLAIFDGAWLPNTGEDGPSTIHPDLTLVTPDGSLDWAVPLPTDFRYVGGLGEVVWSRDGRELAITGYLAGPSPALFPSSLWIVDTQARTIRELGSSTDASLGVTTSDFRPRWLPDGTILFSRPNGGIWQVDPRTGVESLVYKMEAPEGGARFISVLEPSPDGARVAFMAPKVWLGVLDLATGAVTVAKLGEGALDLPIGWMPDGAALITRWGEKAGPGFFATHVVKFDVATGQVTNLADDVVAYSLRP